MILDTYSANLERLSDAELLAEATGKIGCYRSARDSHSRREYGQLAVACHAECVRRGCEDLWTKATKEAKR